jgi:2-haloacid dehalogenase
VRYRAAFPSRLAVTKMTIGFDVYGTLVDPLGMSAHLAPLVGEESAERAASAWRTKQIEYAFRRAAMNAYADFTVCTRQALAFTCRQLDVPLTVGEERRLLDAYLRLPAYPDVVEGLESLRGTEHRLVAFSNGTSAAVRAVLANAGVLPFLDDVVSVDDVRALKPAQAVYRYLAERGGRPLAQTWLVSSNGWDVIGAAHAGLRTVWLTRDPNQILDPWDIAPNGVVTRIADVAGIVARG